MKNIRSKIYTGCIAGVGLFLSSCKPDTPILSLGLEEVYYLPRMCAYRFNPGYTGEEYRWTLHLPDGRDSLLSTEQAYTFVQMEEGSYPLTFEIMDLHAPFKFSFLVQVVREKVEYSPYISRVLEYCPAPGQFVNELPRYDPGDTGESMRKKVEQHISGKNDVMITLGGFGGYVVFGFDHTVMNATGKRDFSILANAFYSLIDVGKRGGACEPGVVLVAFDRNQNGKPDEDEWFELAGSEYYKPETLKGYRITYVRPDENKVPVPGPSPITDRTYLAWSDNQGETGYLYKNGFHTQEYYPKWVTSDELTFEGTRLKENGEDVSRTGRYWVQYAYDWGYADNHPNDSTDRISFDIDWAVDKNGRKVHLPGIDFVRVHTGVNQNCGQLGEASTEIVRAEDLHLLESKEDPLPDLLCESKITANSNK